MDSLVLPVSKLQYLTSEPSHQDICFPATSSIKDEGLCDTMLLQMLSMYHSLGGHRAHQLQ